MVPAVVSVISPLGVMRLLVMRGSRIEEGKQTLMVMRAFVGFLNGSSCLTPNTVSAHMYEK